MPITVISGRPGAGKSLLLAQKILDVLKRNERWEKKSGILRPVHTNLRLNEKLEKKFERFLRFWTDPLELVKVQDADVFIDEIARYFDANQWKETGLEVKAWLQQHRKIGVEIYGNAQDFSQVDIAFRRMTSDLFYLVKIISSRDPSPTRPPVRWIWGLSMIYTISPVDYKEDSKENKSKWHSFMFINRERTEVFDTRQKILAGKFPPYKHIERFCEHGANCSEHYSRILHV